VRSGRVTERLGTLAFGYDHWWHPNDEDEAHAAAAEVAELLRTWGEEWFLAWTDAATAINRLRWWESPLPAVQVVGALLVERPGDPRRAAVAEKLEHGSDGGRSGAVRTCVALMMTRSLPGSSVASPVEND
jgi:hypothetical protein